MKTEAADQVLTFGSRQIRYQLRLGAVKRLRIVVRPNLRVHVRAPDGYSEDEIHQAIRSKAPWIAKQLDALAAFHPLPVPHRYISGETFIYLGRQYRLKVEEGRTTKAKLRGRFLHIAVRDKHDSTLVRNAVTSWYRTRAKEVFRRYLDACMKVVGRHGIANPILEIRDMRTRWGSCSASGRVILNLRLIQAPVHCIEYVAMHELCHLAHHNHSQAFYRLLTRCMPDWVKRKMVLNSVAI
jgi:predicted metal-dependent hydrolase